MDINELFNKPDSDQPVGVQSRTRTVSLVSYLNTKPLIYGLENKLVSHPFVLQKDVPSVCAERLKEGEVELGIIPSIEYAFGKGAWRIIPDLCIASKAAVRSVALYFKKDLRNISKIALDTSSRTSVALLKILMRERYQISPEFIVMAPNLEEMLNRADAALIIGDKALHYQLQNPMHIDLGEEWFDLTGLPFVYAFWAGHEMALSQSDVSAVQKSYQLGARHIEDISKKYARNASEDWTFYHSYLTENISYQFGEEEKQGLMEFYRYAFYFGLIEHIPELHFYGE